MGETDGMADSAESGKTYTIKPGTFAWNFHFNEKTVIAEESYASPSAEIVVRCTCCGDRTRVHISDLD